MCQTLGPHHNLLDSFYKYNNTSASHFSLMILKMFYMFIWKIKARSEEQDETLKMQIWKIRAFVNENIKNRQIKVNVQCGNDEQLRFI